jgi:D-3-phosphoglycerate dehydrogenase / 2-oxoglutarate reductase
MTTTILLSAPYMIPVFDRFRSIFEASGLKVIVPDVHERMSEVELMEYAGLIDGVIGGDDRFTASVLQAFTPRLKVISKWGTGIDSIDQDAARNLGVEVCNTPNAFSHPVADSVLQYILLFARGGTILDKKMKSGRWEKIITPALNECTLGVIGVGNVGKQVLRRAKPFGCRLLGTDIIEINPEFVSEINVEMTDLKTLLRESDFVSVNAGLTPSSFHLINAQALALMKPSAYLVNTARGPIIEQPSLVEALISGKLAGAGLDVFEDEPLSVASPLLKMDNVYLSPHNTNSSPRAWEIVHFNTLRNLFNGLGLELPEELKSTRQ